MDSHRILGDIATGSPALGEIVVHGFSSPDATADPTTAVGPHILLVDDEPINGKVIQKFLAAGGYHRFSLAESGQQGLDIITRDLPDLVLLDIFLGDINGIEVLKKLRTMPEARHLPVLILTASDDPDLKRVALELGALGFITKPIHQAELLAWLQKGLQSPPR